MTEHTPTLGWPYNLYYEDYEVCREEEFAQRRKDHGSIANKFIEPKVFFENIVKPLILSESGTVNENGIMKLPVPGARVQYKFRKEKSHFELAINSAVQMDQESLELLFRIALGATDVENGVINVSGHNPLHTLYFYNHKISGVHRLECSELLRKAGLNIPLPYIATTNFYLAQHIKGKPRAYFDNRYEGFYVLETSYSELSKLEKTIDLLAANPKWPHPHIVMDQNGDNILFDKSLKAWHTDPVIYNIHPNSRTHYAYLDAKNVNTQRMLDIDYDTESYLRVSSKVSSNSP